MTNYQEYIDIQLGDRGSSFGMRSIECITSRNNYCKQNFYGLNKSISVLEVGCGDGVNLQWFCKNGFTNVTGCDIDEAKIHLATSYTDYPTRLADLHYMDQAFTTERYDIIIASHCLEHCIYPKLVLKHLHTFLNNNGSLYVVLPYPEPFDPENISHVSNVELGMGEFDGGQSVVKFFTEDGMFKVDNLFLQTNNKPEIWLTLRKL